MDQPNNSGVLGRMRGFVHELKRRASRDDGSSGRVTWDTRPDPIGDDYSGGPLGMSSIHNAPPATPPPPPPSDLVVHARPADDIAAAAVRPPPLPTAYMKAAATTTRDASSAGGTGSRRNSNSDVGMMHVDFLEASGVSFGSWPAEEVRDNTGPPLPSLLTRRNSGAGASAAASLSAAQAAHAAANNNNNITSPSTASSSASASSTRTRARGDDVLP
jgi:hypothetical protein